MADRGRWYGDNVYFGLHYDLHVQAYDTVIGAHATPDELIPSLRLMNPQWVQTDCKGIPGLTSWYSQVPTASVCQGIVKDALAGWREATRRLGLKLHCHYSGLWDYAAAERFPDWRVVPNPTETAPTINRAMCPRRGYLEGLMLPQMFELIDRYGVDGFWVDCELWALTPCYCDKCRSAYSERTGRAEPPTRLDDPNWVDWIECQRAGFLEYVAHYTEAIHAHNPNTLVCSNWLQTFRDPGEPATPTDWISGDWWAGMDILRCESRFISTRGKPWDVMLWNYYHYQADPKSETHVPYTVSSVNRLKQQAAHILAFGGNLQLYESSANLRDGRLVPWQMQRLGEVGQWVLARQELCQGAASIPQAVVLHSEVAFRKTPVKNLFWDYDTQGVEGATYGLLDSSIATDIMDEWALLPQLNRFPLVVAPEQNGMSQAMADALIDYVEQGGCLLVTGADAFERFGSDFLGAEVKSTEHNASFHVPVAERAVQLSSTNWGLLNVLGGKALGYLGTTPLPDDELTPYPAAVLNEYGRGRVLWVPLDLFHFYKVTRYPEVRAWLGELLATLAPKFNIRIQAPAGLDVVLRRKNGKTIIHLINLAQVVPSYNSELGDSEIAPAGPVLIELDCTQIPQRATAAFENVKLERDYRSTGKGIGIYTLKVSNVQIHCAIVIE